MGLFDTSKRRLESLEREVLANPTPQNMVALAEAYARQQDWGRAFDVAKRAIEKFPDSEKCALTFQYIRKTQFQAQIQEINRALRTRPQQGDYEKLARIYLDELKDSQKAYEVALEGINKFPSSDSLHGILAVIRMDRFHQEYLGNDGSEALRHAQLALATNSSHAQAMLVLGRIYAECGAFEKAKPYVESYLRMTPTDEPMGQLRTLIDAHLAESVHDLDDAFMEIETRHGLSPVGLEMMQIFQPVRGATQVTISPAKVEMFLKGYETMGGYKCSAVILKDGTLLAAHTRGMVAQDRFVNLVQKIYRSADDASRKMEIGSFVDGEVETSLGRVKLSEWKNVVMGLLADKPAKTEDFNRAIEKFQSFLA